MITIYYIGCGAGVYPYHRKLHFSGEHQLFLVTPGYSTGLFAELVELNRYLTQRCHLEVQCKPFTLQEILY